LAPDNLFLPKQINITTKNRKPYRRCGMSFGAEKTPVELSELSHEQIKLLTTDHNLVCVPVAAEAAQ
jgi:hypothetical protein